MKLNNIPKNELELLSYKEIAKMYLEENKVTKNTAICRRFYSMEFITEEEKNDLGFKQWKNK